MRPDGLDGNEYACNAEDLGLILDREDLLEQAAHSSILAWRVPWTEEPAVTVHGVTKY